MQKRSNHTGLSAWQNLRHATIAAAAGLMLVGAASQLTAQPEGQRGPGDGVRKPMDGPKHGGPRHHRQLSESDLETALEIVGNMRPEMVRPLKHAMEENPARVERILRERFPQLDRMLQLRRYDREMFDLRMADLRAGQETLAAARAMRQARDRNDQAEVETQSAALRKAVEDHFEVRRKLREVELARMEARIAELREDIAKEADQREQHVDQRVTELVEGDLPEEARPRPHGPRDGKWKGKKPRSMRDGDTSYARPNDTGPARDTTSSKDAPSQ